ncbi:MAG: glycosyltransferase, partial [Flavobacteriia bacterium]
GFFGATPELLNNLVSVLCEMYPGLIVSYSMAPPFREITADEDNKYIDAINSSGVKILFVGLGCPKQEKWMAEHKEVLHCTMLGVGAAFDFITGNKKHAPAWMQKIGMEWLFRLASEPRRLWKRYLKHNPRFVYYLILQLLGKKYV